ncbi:shikimate kinase [Myxococcus fulvus]|uniref:Shikimate kinase n=1 Tax=Myxococcus fulvus TaxID=33 RepID=A0ABY1C8H3_MYXFU|nr:shikimate kinase [Myxococcus fulvus]SET80221.1 shikimate kinase [Myxococcus fulvus]
MSASSAEPRRHLVEHVLSSVDPRLTPALRDALTRPGPTPRPAAGQTVVLGGHRGAGKSTLLPRVARLLGRTGVDLDTHLERTHGRPLRTWVAQAPSEFRAAERRALLELPPGGLVAVGGGFLSHHPDALAGAFTLIIPVTFETYRERLLTDRTRPRLRPEVSLEEEIASIFHEREALHARVPTIALVDFLRGCLHPEEVL